MESPLYPHLLSLSFKDEFMGLGNDSSLNRKDNRNEEYSLYYRSSTISGKLTIKIIY
jgi:hypothetical protein